MTSKVQSAMGIRKLHLAALHAVITHQGSGGAPHGLVCELVSRALDTPVLKVTGAKDLRKSVQVGCERCTDDQWWFILAATGEGIVQVTEVDRAPAALAGILARETR